MYRLELGVKRLALLGMLALLAGCGGSSAVPNGPVRSLPRQFDSLQFELTADRAVYRTGQTVNLTFVVTNIGTQPITYTAAYPGIMSASVSQNGATIWQLELAGGEGIANVTLNPGDTSRSTFPFTWDQTTTTGTVARRGIYTIVAWFSPSMIPGIQIGPGVAQSQLESNPIQIWLER